MVWRSARVNLIKYDVVEVSDYKICMDEIVQEISSHENEYIILFKAFLP
jgi:hypothetical protein